MICKNLYDCIQNNVVDCNSPCIVQKGNYSKIVCKENKKEYTLNNSNKYTILKCHLDTGAITGNEEKKCDYLINILNIKNLIFVELKGKSINKACEQIEASLLHFKKLTKFYSIHARIIGTSVPKVYPPNAIKLKKICDLIIKSESFEENVHKFN